MASDLNKVMLIGRLGSDPEQKFTPSGTPVTSVSLATNEEWTKDGEKQIRTEWHNLVFWRKLSEVVVQYLKKGSKVYVEGQMQTRSWEDEKNQRHYKTEVVVRELKMLDSRGDGQGEGRAFPAGQPSQPGGDPAPSQPYTEDDDLPF